MNSSRLSDSDFVWEHLPSSSSFAACPTDFSSPTDDPFLPPFANPFLGDICEADSRRLDDEETLSRMVFTAGANVTGVMPSSSYYGHGPLTTVCSLENSISSESVQMLNRQNQLGFTFDQDQFQGSQRSDSVSVQQGDLHGLLNARPEPSISHEAFQLLTTDNSYVAKSSQCQTVASEGNGWLVEEFMDQEHPNTETIDIDTIQASVMISSRLVDSDLLWEHLPSSSSSASQTDSFLPPFANLLSGDICEADSRRLDDEATLSRMSGQQAGDLQGLVIDTPEPSISHEALHPTQLLTTDYSYVATSSQYQIVASEGNGWLVEEVYTDQQHPNIETIDIDLPVSKVASAFKRWTHSTSPTNPPHRDTVGAQSTLKRCLFHMVYKMMPPIGAGYGRQCFAQDASAREHMIAERRRRCRQSERLKILRSMLPSNNTKKDKAGILECAINHLRKLEARVQDLEMHNGSVENVLTPPLLSKTEGCGSGRYEDDSKFSDNDFLSTSPDIPTTGTGCLCSAQMLEVGNDDMDDSLFHITIQTSAHLNNESALIQILTVIQDMNLKTLSVQSAIERSKLFVQISATAMQEGRRQITTSVEIQEVLRRVV